MNPVEQFKVLKAWVLPNDDHAAFRMYGQFTPKNVLPSDDQLQKPRIDSDDSDLIPHVRRQFSGGKLYARVFDLIAVAKSLNRLDELAKLVEPSGGDSPIIVPIQDWRRNS